MFYYSKFCEPVPHRIVIFTKKKSNSLRKYLNKFGIGVRTLFIPMHRQPIYNNINKFEKKYGEIKTPSNSLSSSMIKLSKDKLPN